MEFMGGENTIKEKLFSFPNIIAMFVFGIPAAALSYRETSNGLISVLAFIFGRLYLLYFAIRYGFFQPHKLCIRDRD